VPGAVPLASAEANRHRGSRDGRRMFFISADKKLMAVDFEPAMGRPARRG
jgi:hypothetical protein